MVASNGTQTKRGIKLATKSTYPKDFNAPGVYDLCQTPAYAVEPLLKYIPREWVIWESACGEGYLSRAIERAGYESIGTDIQGGFNYFYWSPDWYDCQITNPPYSLKLEWIQRAYDWLLQGV
jgi:hypothetical protein